MPQSHYSKQRNLLISPDWNTSGWNLLITLSVCVYVLYVHLHPDICIKSLIMQPQQNSYMKAVAAMAMLATMPAINA